MRGTSMWKGHFLSMFIVAHWRRKPQQWPHRNSKPRATSSNSSRSSHQGLYCRASLHRTGLTGVAHVLCRCVYVTHVSCKYVATGTSITCAAGTSLKSVTGTSLNVFCSHVTHISCRCVAPVCRRLISQFTHFAGMSLSFEAC